MLWGLLPSIAISVYFLLRGRSHLSTMKRKSSTQQSSAAALRIIHITDVYLLDNFPPLRTLIKEKRSEFESMYGNKSKTISMLTGDFLMPYLLSTIDKGKGMMEMLNETPIDYLTWGNHENDLGHKYLIEREKEYKGAWVNSNMQSHSTFQKSDCQVDAAVIDLESYNTHNNRKVGLIGVMTDKLKAGAFNGAVIEDPWAVMQKYNSILKEERKCDLVIPLCHLYEPSDEKTAREFDFPLILSGHDHHVVDKVVEGSRILKPGSDGHKAFVIDIVWPSADTPSGTPNIEVQLVDVNTYTPDRTLQQKVQKAYTVLDNLRNTQLTVVSEGFRPLSSVNSRGSHSTMGSFMCTSIRKALNIHDHALTTPTTCDCVMIKAGSCPRGEKAYTPQDHITLETLQSEIQQKSDIFIYEVPGRVIRGGIAEKWGGQPNPGYMQYCDAITIDPRTHHISHINGVAIEDDKLYKVGSTSDFIRSGDGAIIGSYFEGIEGKAGMPCNDSGIPPHALLMRYWAEEIWKIIFESIDKDGDNIVCEADLACLDRDSSGGLSRNDLLRILEERGYRVYQGECGFVDTILEVAGDEDFDGNLTVTEINKRRSYDDLTSLV